MHRNFLLTFLGCCILFLASCEASREITDGPTAYRLKKYDLATRLLKADFEKAAGPEKANIAWRVAKSYAAINQPGMAAQWYQKALELGIQQDARFMMARALMADGQYKAAIQQFEAIQREEPYRRGLMQDYIAACRQALQSKNNPSLITLSPVSSLNTIADEFSLTPYIDKQWVFTSNRSGAEGEAQDQWTGKSFFDMYVATKENATTFSGVTPFDPLLNTPYNDGPVAFNSSFTELVYTQCGSDDMMTNDACQLYYSRKTPEGGWSEPEQILVFEDTVNMGQPVWDPSDQAIYFAAVAPQGYGGTDLYYSVRSLDGWSPAINLGKPVNTAQDEAFPYFGPNGHLYFASNGHIGFGGLDLFYATPAGNNRFSDPVRLPYPINASGDDFGIVQLPLQENEKITLVQKGYLSSSRPGGQGGDDLYYFEERKPPARYELVVAVKEKILQDTTNPQSKIIGYQPITGTEVVLSSGKGPLDTLYTDTSGMVHTDLTANTDYTLRISNGPRYFSTTTTTTTNGYNPLPGEVVTIKEEVVLDRIFKEKEIVIPNIYYDFNKWDIRPDAADVLDSTIYKLLVDNPSLVIELGSHTDSRGSDQFNLELSQKRAQSVVDYLTAKGIDPARLKAKGYGETQLVNNCDDGIVCTEEEHQRNRRTTFRVLSADFETNSVAPENILVDPGK